MHLLNLDARTQPYRVEAYHAYVEAAACAASPDLLPRDADRQLASESQKQAHLPHDNFCKRTNEVGVHTIEAVCSLDLICRRQGLVWCW